MKTTELVLADDHAMFRAGIRALLDSLPGVKVVGEASDGLEALALIAKHQPDIVLLDIQMPGLDGLLTLERITKEHPRVKVILLTMHRQEEYVIKAFAAGAAGYLLKGAGPDELEAALAATTRGEKYLSRAISMDQVEAYSRRQREKYSPLERLSPRQRQTLQLLAEGNTVKEIAQKLGISVKTVETHRAQLMQVLEIHDVPGLVRFAIRMGLVSSENRD